MVFIGKYFFRFSFNMANGCFVAKTETVKRLDERVVKEKG